MKKDSNQELDMLLEEMEVKNLQLRHADKLATLGTLASGIMHEINNPLGYISGNQLVIKEKYLPIIEQYTESQINITDRKLKKALDEIGPSLDGISEGVKRIKELTTAIKQFSRKSTEMTKFSKRLNVNLQKAIELSQISLSKRIELTSEIEESLPIYQLESYKLEQVIINIMTNASHALEETKSPQVTIKAFQIRKHTEIHIIDNGPGIPEDKLQEIWDPFFTTKDEETGTGLGLSICREIIENLQGTITALNNDDSGAHFIIKLPINDELQDFNFNT